MGFLENFFHTQKDVESVILIDIGTGSVAGAYALYTAGKQPTLLYSRRLPVEIREGEPKEKAMLRALSVLGAVLIREGAPTLLRATGSGSAGSIFVSIDAPWEETKVRTEHLEQKDPFTFTREMVTAALGKTSHAPDGQILADESVIGTILNGYETRDPYGKEASRATIIVLTSLIDEGVAESIQAIIRGLFHTKNIIPIAGSSLRYQAMRIAFPHEHDAFIIDATGGDVTSLELVRKGLLVNIAEVEDDTENVTAWMRSLTNELKDIAERFPLPRTLFLLAREPEILSLRETLDAAKLGELWLSDNPPKIIPVLGSHLGGLVRQEVASPDFSLLLMALYFQHRDSGRRD